MENHLLECYRGLALSSEDADSTSIMSQIRLEADEEDRSIGAKMSHLGIPLSNEHQDLNIEGFNSSYLVSDILQTCMWINCEANQYDVCLWIAQRS
jgi:hypothetical protein